MSILIIDHFYERIVMIRDNSMEFEPFFEDQ